MISCLVCRKQVANDCFPFDAKRQHEQLFEAGISHLSPIDISRNRARDFYCSSVSSYAVPSLHKLWDCSSSTH